jgi:hypothetical protein
MDDIIYIKTATSFEQFKQELEARASNIEKHRSADDELLRMLGKKLRQPGIAAAFADTCATKFEAGRTSVTRDELVRLHLGNPRYIDGTKLSGLMRRCKRLLEESTGHHVTPVWSAYFKRKVELSDEAGAQKYLAGRGHGKFTAGLVCAVPGAANWLLLAETRNNWQCIRGNAHSILSHHIEDGIADDIATKAREWLTKYEAKMRWLDGVAAEWHRTASAGA